MYKKPFDPNEAIVVLSGDQARVVVGNPSRAISADGLTKCDVMAITNIDGVNKNSAAYMPPFEEAFVNMLLRWAQPVSKDDICEYVVHYFGGLNKAKTRALEYLDYLEQPREPDQLILDQTIDSLISCYVNFERWADQHADGTLTLTKGGRVIREMKFGTTRIRTVD